MDEELVQQQLWLGTDVVLGSAVAAVSIVHTGLLLEMLSRQSEFRWSFPCREMLVFWTFGKLSLTNT